MRFFFAAGCLLVLAPNLGLAADQNGKLWVERAAPQKKIIRTTIKKSVRQSAPAPAPASRNQRAAQTGSRHQGQAARARSNDRPYGQQVNSGSRGITRNTLPPVQNAPVDRNYGRSGPTGSDQGSYQRGRRSSAQKIQLPPRLWQGMSFERFRDAVLKLNGAGGSPVLNNLLVSALLDRGSRPGNVDRETHDLLKMVVLYRMGRIRDLTEFINTIPANARSLPVRVFEARALLASGNSAKACTLASAFPVGDPGLSRDLLSEALMMTALCAAMKKDMQTMGLIADLARDKGIRSPLSYGVIDYLLSGVKPSLRMPARLGVRDYYFLRLTNIKPPRKLLGMADPALVYALAFDRSSPLALRLDAAEQAARRGQIDASGLASIYGQVAGDGSLRRRQRRSDAQTRALLYDGLLRTNDPQHRAKIIDTLLSNARGQHLSLVIGPMVAPYVAQMQPAQNLDWFAMRAIEVALLSGDMKLAERWFLFVKQAGRKAYMAAEWLPLTDLVQKNVVPSGEGAQMAMRMANARRLDGSTLHQLTSVLDALSFNVPIPLWNTAGKKPQPNKGALPAPGVLSKLKKLSDEGRPGEVLLMSLQAVGPNGADEMHLIALGDIVRSLKKAGFDEQAGQFGFEALYGNWPTGQGRRR